MHLLKKAVYELAAPPHMVVSLEASPFSMPAHRVPGSFLLVLLDTCHFLLFDGGHPHGCEQILWSTLQRSESSRQASGTWNKKLLKELSGGLPLVPLRPDPGPGNGWW